MFYVIIPKPMFPKTMLRLYRNSQDISEISGNFPALPKKREQYKSDKSDKKDHLVYNDEPKF